PQPADHCLDPGARGPGLLEQRGAFRHQRFLAAAQDLVLFPQARALGQQEFHLQFQASQLFVNGISHLSVPAEERSSILERPGRPGQSRPGGRRRSDKIDGQADGEVQGMKAGYQQVEEALRAVDAVTQAAEAQGLLAGMASSAGTPDKAAWIAQVLADASPRGEPAKTCLAVLVALYDQTLRELDDDGLGFQPLLPDDSGPRSERARALGRWASGFLVGMGLGGLKR